MEHKFKTIDCWVDEHRLLELLSNKQHSFNLHSDFGNERLGRYSILGADPFLTFTSFKNEIVVNKKGKKMFKLAAAVLSPFLSPQSLHVYEKEVRNRTRYENYFSTLALHI